MHSSLLCMVMQLTEQDRIPQQVLMYIKNYCTVKSFTLFEKNVQYVLRCS